MIKIYSKAGVLLKEVDAKTLTEANLTWANLTEANLRGVNLTEANLTGVNLTEADLTWANLRGVNLRGANLTGVNLAVVHLDRYTALVQSTHTRIGCQFRDNDYWRSASDEMISSMAGDALEWWTAYKPIIFATMAALEAKFPMKEEVA